MIEENLFWCLGGILGGGLISAFFYFLSLKRNRITYTIDTTTIVSKNNAKIEGLVFSYCNEPIQELYATNVNIKNAGNTVINSDDFAPSEPLAILTSGKFLIKKNESVKLKTYEKSSNISIQYNYDLKTGFCSKIIFTFDYLSKKEDMTLTFFHTGNITIQGKLKDGKILTDYSNSSTIFLTALYSILLIILFTLILSLLH